MFWTIDLDDQVGQFFKFVGVFGSDGYLIVINGEDGQSFMIRNECDVIMGVWV